MRAITFDRPIPHKYRRLIYIRDTATRETLGHIGYCPKAQPAYRTYSVYGADGHTLVEHCGTLNDAKATAARYFGTQH